MRRARSLFAAREERTSGAKARRILNHLWPD
jgi:hypothetical protein